MSLKKKATPVKSAPDLPQHSLMSNKWCQMKVGFVCFRVRIVSRNHTDELKIPIKGTDSSSGSFPVSTSVQFISVWVYVENLLNSSNSSVINYTLSDIGETHIMCSSLEYAKCLATSSQRAWICVVTVSSCLHCWKDIVMCFSDLFSTHSRLVFITDHLWHLLKTFGFSISICWSDQQCLQVLNWSNLSAHPGIAPSKWSSLWEPITWRSNTQQEDRHGQLTQTK